MVVLVRYLVSERKSGTERSALRMFEASNPAVGEIRLRVRLHALRLHVNILRRSVILKVDCMLTLFFLNATASHCVDNFLVQ